MHILETIDQSTVIDDNWYADGTYLTQRDCFILIALLRLTELDTYTQVLEIYEGWTIKDLLESKSITK